MRIKELRKLRGKALADARAINDQAARENRRLSDEERDNYNKYMADYHALGDDIKREEELEAEERGMTELVERQADANQRGGGSLVTGEQAQREMRAFEHFLRTGEFSEYRALQVDANTSGGFLLAPQQMADALIKAVDNALHIRQLATKFRVATAESLGAVSLDADPADPEWTTELTSGNTDTAMAFGKRELHPHEVKEKLLISKKMIRKIPGIAELVRARLAYKMAVKHENAFLNGNGNGKPLGLFVASNQGISTGRDVSTGNLATALTVDGLKRARGSVKAAYRNSAACRWLFHRDVVTEISLLKDGEGRYMLTESIREDEGEILLGKRILESEYAPNTMTASQYVGLFGDFSHYWIADAEDIRFQYLVEKYAGEGQDGYHIESETDGMPVLEEAFSRVKLGS